MRRNRIILSLLIAAGLAIAAWAAPAPKAKKVSAKASTKTSAKAAAVASAADYVGTKKCIACHIKFAKGWSKIPHNKILTASSRKPSESGCEACHGPGKAHVTNDRAKIVKFDESKATSADSACLKCHAPIVTAAEWKASSHAKIGLGCLTCHDPHRPKVPAELLRSASMGKCRTCHGAIVQAASEGKHHKLPQGIECTQCHTPHGSKFGKGLVKPKEELCKGCHGEGAGKPASHKAPDFKQTHGKIAKTDDSSCMSCHDKQKFCTNCHGIEMPHPEGWMMSHKDHGASLAADSKCFKCHERKKSCVCHGNAS